MNATIISKYLTRRSCRIIDVIFQRPGDCQVSLKSQQDRRVNRANESNVLQLVEEVDEEFLKERMDYHCLYFLSKKRVGSKNKVDLILHRLMQT